MAFNLFKSIFGPGRKTPQRNTPNPFDVPEADNVPNAIALTHNEQFFVDGGVLTAGSTNVEEIGPYDWQAQTLVVRFKSGGVYEYYGMPLDEVVKFAESDSPGRFVWSHIRDVYSYAKVGTAPARPKPNVIRGYH